jgi:hypothetical protein
MIAGFPTLDDDLIKVGGRSRKSKKTKKSKKSKKSRKGRDC